MTLTAEELFNTNKSLVGWCYKKYFGDYGSIHCEDIIQEGMLGLWEVCNRFDETKGFQFATYAIPFIVGRMRQYYRNKCNVIRIPRMAFEGDTDTLNKLCNTASLDLNIEQDDGSGITLGELIPDNSTQYEEFHVEDLIDSFLKTINNSQHRDMMEDYYYNYIWGLTRIKQHELADKYGMSQSYCARLIRRYNSQFSKFMEK